MGKYFTILILLNYILSMTTLFISMLKRWSLFTFLKNLLFLAVGINLIILIIGLIIKTLENKKEDESIIDLVVPTESEEEIKQILKEASSLDADDEFKDWTPDNWEKGDWKWLGKLICGRDFHKRKIWRKRKKLKK